METTLWDSHHFSLNKTIIQVLVVASSDIIGIDRMEYGLLVDRWECVVWKQQRAQELAEDAQDGLRDWL